jgi:hypothetical protein
MKLWMNIALINVIRKAAMHRNLKHHFDLGRKIVDLRQPCVTRTTAN